jgi:hypothetical protein
MHLCSTHARMQQPTTLSLAEQPTTNPMPAASSWTLGLLVTRRILHVGRVTAGAYTNTHRDRSAQHRQAPAVMKQA